jgi:hypothetical protein
MSQKLLTLEDICLVYQIVWERGVSLLYLWGSTFHTLKANCEQEIKRFTLYIEYLIYNFYLKINDKTKQEINHLLC